MFPIVSPQIFKVTLDNIGTPVVRAHLLSPFVTTLRGGAEANFRSHGLELGDLNWYHIFKVYYLGLREYTIQIWLIIIYYILLWLDVVQYLNFRYLNGPLIHYKRIYICVYVAPVCHPLTSDNYGETARVSNSVFGGYVYNVYTFVQHIIYDSATCINISTYIYNVSKTKNTHW